MSVFRHVLEPRNRGLGCVRAKLDFTFVKVSTAEKQPHPGVGKSQRIARGFGKVAGWLPVTCSHGSRGGRQRVKQGEGVRHPILQPRMAVNTVQHKTVNLLKTL